MTYLLFKEFIVKSFTFDIVLDPPKNYSNKIFNHIKKKFVVKKFKDWLCILYINVNPRGGIIKCLPPLTLKPLILPLSRF